MVKPKISLIEVPEAKITYVLDGIEEVYSAVRTNYPKQSQLIIAEFLKYVGAVEIVDMKLLNPEREELYKEFPYGNGTIKCYRKGASFESVKDKISDAGILGLTSNFTRSADIVTDFIGYSKEVSPETKIIIGGSDATPRYEYYLKNGADVVVLGEGEHIGPRVVKAIIEDKSLSDISGIAYKKENTIKYNLRNPITDTVNADDIPLPAFDLIKSDLTKYTEAFECPLPEYVKTPIGILETSRGCAEACPFCTTPYLRKKYRYMSTERIKGNCLAQLYSAA